MNRTIRDRTLIGLLVAVVAAVAGWWLGTETADSTRASTVTVTVTAAADGSAGPTESGTTEAAPPPSGTDPESGLPWVAAAALPREGRDTIELIEANGPFPYDRDGAVFGNREGLLPDERRGYYREYTVETPGSDDRGARRIVAGSEGELYYTDDHYDSFRRIGP